MKNNQPQTKSTSNKGFTILEVIVAIFVLTVGIMSIMVLQTSSIQRNSNSRGITEASNWAMDEMEYRKSLNYQHAYLEDGLYSLSNSSHPAIMAGYAVNTEINDIAYLGNPVGKKEILVTVSWQNFGSFGKQKSVTFESIKTKLRD